MINDERKTLARLEYAVDASGEIYIDISIEDYTKSTLNKFALLLASIPTTTFQIQTLEVVQEAFTRDGQLEELKSLISEIIRRQAYLEQIKDSEADIDDDPLINPTDLM